MSGNKKRKAPEHGDESRAAEEEEEEMQLVPHNTNRRGRSFKTALPRHTEHRSFRAHQRDAKQQLISHLNESLQEKLRREPFGITPTGAATTGPFVPLLPHSIRWARNEIDYRHAIRGNNFVIAFGQNEQEQLGLPELVAVEEGDVDPEDQFYNPRRLAVLQGVPIRQVSCGGLHTIAVTSDGEALTWGQSDKGILGRSVSETYRQLEEAIPTPLKGFITRHGHKDDGWITMAAGGQSHSLFLSAYGRLYMCGFFRDDHQTGEYSPPEEAGGKVVIPKKGKPFPVHVPLPEPAVRIWSGQESAFGVVLLESGTLCSFGMGNLGELGRTKDKAEMIVHPKGSMLQIPITQYVTVEVTEKGEEKPRVDESFLRDFFLTPLPVQFQNGMNKYQVSDVACGWRHMLVVACPAGTTKSQVYACGLNTNGQLGDPDLPKTVHELVLVKTLQHETMARVAAGNEHSLALTRDGVRLYAWGRCEKGQLGTGFEKAQGEARGEFQSTPEVVRFPVEKNGSRLTLDWIACGGNHSLAITIDKKLYSWGYDDGNKNLGLGLKEGYDQFIPKLVDFAARWGIDNDGVLQAVGGGLCTIVLAAEPGTTELD